MDNSLGGFNEERQKRSGIFLMERLIAVGQSGISVRALGGSRAGEMRVTRFLRNDDVTPGPAGRVPSYPGKVVAGPERNLC